MTLVLKYSHNLAHSSVDDKYQFLSLLCTVFLISRRVVSHQLLPWTHPWVATCLSWTACCWSSTLSSKAPQPSPQKVPKERTLQFITSLHFSEGTRMSLSKIYTLFSCYCLFSALLDVCNTINYALYIPCSLMRLVQHDASGETCCSKESTGWNEGAGVHPLSPLTCTVCPPHGE